MLRIFKSGANRDSNLNKLDYEGHLSPFVLERYVQFLHEKRLMDNGTLRDADNWQKGIPKEEYFKSGLRHMLDVWKANRSLKTNYLGLGAHRGYSDQKKLEDSVCAVLFNMNGLLFELLKKR